MTISQRLRSLLKAKGLTIASVAENAGMSAQQLHQIVSGTNPNPKHGTLVRIIEAADCTMAEFFSEEQSEKRDVPDYVLVAGSGKIYDLSDVFIDRPTLSFRSSMRKQPSRLCRVLGKTEDIKIRVISSQGKGRRRIWTARMIPECE